MDEVDVVVVGTGTGMLAAITAAERGLSVLVVEKSKHVGGSTSLSGGGFWIPGNSILRENGQKEDRERLITYLQAVTNGEVADERWRTHIEHGPAAVEVMRRNTPLKYQFMREYADYFPELPGGSSTGRAAEPQPFDLAKLGKDRDLLLPPTLKAPFPMPITGKGYKWTNLVTRHPKGLISSALSVAQGVGGKIIGRDYGAGGQALAAGLLMGLRKQGVALWTKAGLKDLIEEDGRIVGVVIDREGQDVTVRVRKGVILASGGFDRSADMRQQYQSEVLDGNWSFGATSNTGEVIRIAQSHGADLAFMEESWWMPALDVPGGPAVMLAERSLPGQIIVDTSGKRFMNEAINYMSAGQILLGKSGDGTPHVPAWIVFDQRYRNRYIFAGGVFPMQALPQSWYDSGAAKKASTIAGLASQLEMPGLVASVDRFNALANAGRDDDFGRGDSAYDRYYGDPTISPNPCLGPIDQGPYYAVRVVPGDLGTCGGVRADRFARALDAEGEVIPGLFAIGNAAGNAFGRVYPGPGATVGQGMSFGYAAAMYLAGALKEDEAIAAG